MKHFLALVLLAAVSVSSVAKGKETDYMDSGFAMPKIDYAQVGKLNDILKEKQAQLEASKRAILEVEISVRDSPAKNTSTILNGAGTTSRTIHVEAVTTFMDKGEGQIVTGDLIVEGDKKLPTVSWQKPAEIKHEFKAELRQVNKDNYIVEWGFSKKIEHINDNKGRNTKKSYATREFFINQSTALSAKENTKSIPIICVKGTRPSLGCEAIAEFKLVILEK